LESLDISHTSTILSMGFKPYLLLDLITIFMNTKRTHVVISEQLLKDIDILVGARQRSTFLTTAAEKELMRHRQIMALKGALGTWKNEDHTELKGGSVQWVRKLRKENNRRFKKVTVR